MKGNTGIAFKVGPDWLAQSVEHASLDLGVMRSSPTSGVEITLRKKGRPLRRWGCVLSLGDLVQLRQPCVPLLPVHVEAQAWAFGPLNGRAFHLSEVTGEFLKPVWKRSAANTSLLGPDPRELGPDVSDTWFSVLCRWLGLLPSSFS